MVRQRSSNQEKKKQDNQKKVSLQKSIQQSGLEDGVGHVHVGVGNWLNP